MRKPITRAGSCNKVISYVIENLNPVLFVREDFEYNSSVLNKFKKYSNKLKKECNTPLPPEWLKSQFTKIKEYSSFFKSFKNEVQNKYPSNKFIILRDVFEFEESNKKSSLKLHVIDNGNSIIMNILFDKNKIEKNILTTLKEHKKKNITIFGTIEYWSPGSHTTLTIIPITMY